MSDEKFKFPTEIIELPSKGKVYPPEHPLSSGTVEMKYMTAKEEDILTNQNLIDKGTVLDKLMESLTMGKINIKDILPGDKNALLLAARVLGYGKDYSFIFKDKEYSVDLSQIDNKPFDESIMTENGTVKYTLPKSQAEIEFKFLTEKDTDLIDKELEGLKKVNVNNGGEVTTRLKRTIVSVNGSTDKNEIKDFIDNYLLAQDSRALRSYIRETSPDVDLTYNTGNEVVDIPITLNFFWPDL